MTARQPRRTRRRTPLGTTLARPSAVAAENESAASQATQASSRARRPLRHREHHVTTDYSHVHRDLLTVLGIGVVVLAFIFGMSFII